jgi:hypothetical protein
VLENSPKTENEEIILNPFHDARTTLIPKIFKDIIRKENNRLIFLMTIFQMFLQKY